MTLSPTFDPLTPGQQLGPYVLLSPLGAGGSGRVWAAARLGQLGFSKRLVLKVMRSDRLASATARERFDHEARLGARLSHPNLRAVHDLGSHEGRPYMALSWVDTSLAELLEHSPDRRLDAEVACWIGMQCSAALEAAHGWVEPSGRARAIVHRDVSPGNILLSAEGHALLADLAADHEEGGSPGGGAGRAAFFGSLAYASPEALRQEPLDGRADVYSLGCVLFEALAGRPAFEGDDEPTVMFQVLERGAPELARLAPAVPPALARVVQRCLERRREQRFRSAAELWAELSACAAGRTGFELERETAQLVQRVLGESIREREVAMQRAFHQLVPSPFERTDTLPLAELLGAEPAPPASPPELSRSEAGATLDRPPPHPHRARTLALTLLVALPLAVALFARYERLAWRSGGMSPPAPSSTSAPLRPPEPQQRPVREARRAVAPPAVPAAGPAAADAATGPAAPARSDAPAPAPPAPAPPSRARARPPTRAGSAGSARPRLREEQPPPTTRTPPAPARDDPFSTLRLEVDPYARRARRASERPPPRPAPIEPPPSAQK